MAKYSITQVEMAERLGVSSHSSRITSGVNCACIGNAIPLTLLEVGAIEAGKRTDLMIVDGDPLANISNVRRVRRAVHGGKPCDNAQLWRRVGFAP